MRTHILYYINAFMCACVKKLTLPFVSNSLPEEKCAIVKSKKKKIKFTTAIFIYKNPSILQGATKSTHKHTYQ